MPDLLVAPLTQFSADAEVDLGGIRIARTPPQIRSILEHGYRILAIQAPSPPPPYSLVAPDVPNVDGREKMRPLEEAVLRLRLLKVGPVGVSFAVRLPAASVEPPDPNVLYELPPRDTQFIALRHYVVWARAGYPPIYHLDSAVLPTLQALFDDHRVDLLRSMPFRHFFRSYHEPYGADRLLSNVIGLEGILLGKDVDRSNLAHKFALRGAYILSRADHRDPAAAFKELKALYGKRSELAHGSDVPEDLPEADLPRLWFAEDALRLCLRYSLDHTGFSAPKVDEMILELIRASA